MHARSETGRLLHEDHQRMLATIDRLEAHLARHRDAVPDPARDEGARGFFAEFDASLGREIDRHFAFEEEALFPLVAAAGAYELPAALAGEHDEIRRLARRLRQICAAALSDGLDPEDWTLFVLFASDLIERQVAHLETEEIALLQAVDDLLSPEQDHELAVVLASSEGRAA